MSPSLAACLSSAGRQVKLARLRRHLSRAAVCAEAGISQQTLIRLESGEASVAIGVLARVLEVMGLEGDIASIAMADPEGRAIQDRELLHEDS